MSYGWFFIDGRQVYRRIKNDNVQRSSLPCPMIISDQIEIKSMVDGQMYTSKRALRQSYRANGYIEVGNEEQKIQKPKPDRKAIRNSVRRAANQLGIST